MISSHILYTYCSIYTNLPWSLVATEYARRFGDRRALKLYAWLNLSWRGRTAPWNASSDASMLVLSTARSPLALRGYKRLNRVLVRSKRCSMKTRPGKSVLRQCQYQQCLTKILADAPCPIFLCECISVATIFESSCELSVDNHSFAVS